MSVISCPNICKMHLSVWVENKVVRCGLVGICRQWPTLRPDKALLGTKSLRIFLSIIWRFLRVRGLVLLETKKRLITYDLTEVNSVTCGLAEPLSCMVEGGSTQCYAVLYPDLVINPAGNLIYALLQRLIFVVRGHFIFDSYHAMSNCICSNV